MVSRIYSASNTALSETQVINARTVQHNAPINPGNSGGPLFDDCGTVIGVNSFSPKGAQGLFFSIHSGEVIRFLRELNIAYAVDRPRLHRGLPLQRRRPAAAADHRHGGHAGRRRRGVCLARRRGGGGRRPIREPPPDGHPGARPSPPAGRDAPREPAAADELGADRGRPLPAAGRGREGLRARGGTHGRRRPGPAVRDHRSRTTRFPPPTPAWRSTRRASV